MAKQLLQINELEQAMSDVLETYSRSVEDKVYRAGYRAIKKLEAKTIDTAPIGRRKNGTHFRDSIATKSQRSRLGESKHIWYVKAPNYRLTHLLVHGHATRNGGRTKANPFLKNALVPVLAQYEKDVEEAIRNG